MLMDPNEIGIHWWIENDMIIIIKLTYLKLNMNRWDWKEYDCEIDFYWNFAINRLPVYTFVFTLSRLFESDVHIS